MDLNRRDLIRFSKIDAVSETKGGCNKAHVSYIQSHKESSKT